MLILISIWFLALLCLIIGSTNSFTESPFQKKHFVINLFTASSFFSMLSVVANYYRHQDK